ncbi:MAG TPA: glycosyltransferase [Rhizomicrobium sp.]|jgi:glycosyltransferase involved in cell wall biosynthesis|nr:glycosyltransferase [Rhizomicrobium sp.]
MARLRARGGWRVVRPLTILSVAYPFAAVREDTAGGAEQILLQLDRAIIDAGHRSIVVAAHGSAVAGELMETPPLPAPVEDSVRAMAHANMAAAIESARRRFLVDIIHLHGIDFHAYLPRAGVPVLITLHLPLAWYACAALIPRRPQTWLHCVSHTQARAAPPGIPLLPVIENGVDADSFPAGARKRNFALFLGRICAEKGVHIAIDAAARARVPLLIAGEVFPYPEHTRYFKSEIATRLNRACRFIGRVGTKPKRWLLAGARCVLIPSLVEETSSLVAREALAAGTPVIGFRRGALLDVVGNGRTGFLVETVDEMAARILEADRIDGNLCREEARGRFPLHVTTDKYLRLYERLVRAPLRAAG